MAQAMVKSPEAGGKGKGRGCCLGGCLGVVFWLALSFVSGWYVCELEHNGWDAGATNSATVDRAGAHLSRLKDWVWDTVSGWFGKEPAAPASSAPAQPRADVAGLVARAEESMGKARVLLQQAGQATGAEQARLVRVALKELQTSYEDYTRAAQQDPDNHKLLQMRVQVSKLIEQLQRR